MSRSLTSTQYGVEQYADIVLNHKCNATHAFFDHTFYRLCVQEKYSELPSPFHLKEEPKVPYSIQIMIFPAIDPPNQDDKFLDIFKHIYIHKNKVMSKDCINICHDSPMYFDWGSHSRNGLMTFNDMLDGMGGMQLRLWTIQPKFQKKITSD